MIEALAAAAAVSAVAALVMAVKLKAAKAALADAEARAGASKPRIVEGRGERFGLLWFPLLTIDEKERKVLSAAAGRPWCPKCLVQLTLLKGPPEEWACSGCQERRAGTAADVTVVDQIIAQAVHEFVARNAGYRPSPGLPTPRPT